MSTYATVQELFAAFSSLSNSDLIALRKAASYRLSGTQYSEPADLIHEALARCVDGRRHWPKEVPFTVFLANVMKSIVSADRNLFSTRYVTLASTLETPVCMDPLGDLSPAAPSAEDDYIAMEDHRLAQAQIENLKMAFSNDPTALAVLSSWLQGLSGKEIISTYSLSEKDYDAARKRVARKVASTSNSQRRIH